MDEKESLEQDKSEQIIRDAISKYRNNSSKDNELKDRIRKMLLLVILTAMILITILLILSGLSKKGSNFEKAETVMLDASKKYYNDKSNLLPKTEGGLVEVSAQKLINEGYMKDLSKYTKVTCNGKVVVENKDKEYLYTAYLDCGEKYKTEELYNKIIEKDNIVTSGDGLYQNGAEYVFKGENVNNYVTLNDELWRIVKVSANKEVVLIKQDVIKDVSLAWDDRYNIDRNYNLGVNEFSVSRVKDNLEKFYNDDTILNDTVKLHMVSHDFCIGKRTVEDTSKNNTSECSKTDNLDIGLLTVSEYMNASLDPNCKSTIDESCQNYNYLVNELSNWWLITGVSNNTYQAYYVEAGGSIIASNAVNKKKIRPVIYLNSRTMFTSGNGSEEKPYKLK